MPLSIQVKLLRVLQDGSFSRVGRQRNAHHRRADHRRHPQEPRRRSRRRAFPRGPLLPAQRGGNPAFPPLRERLEDIPLLAEYFLQRITRKNGMARIRISAEAINTLQSHTLAGQCPRVGKHHRPRLRPRLLANPAARRHPAGLRAAANRRPDFTAAIDQLINAAPAGEDLLDWLDARNRGPGGRTRRRRSQGSRPTC